MRSGLIKNIIRIMCLALFSFSIVLAPQLATAQPQGTGQGQVTGVQSATPGQSQDIPAQMQGLSDEIKNAQQTIEDAMKELKQMIDELNDLRAARPTPPKDSSPEQRDAYIKRKAEWRDKITAKEHQIVAKQAQINQLQKKLSDLQQELANMQKAAGDSSGKRTPVKVMPRR